MSSFKIVLKFNIVIDLYCTCFIILSYVMMTLCELKLEPANNFKMCYVY